MASVSLAGVRLGDLSIELETKKVKGSYALISSAGKVLAKQDFNGYSDASIPLNPAAMEALDAFLKAFGNCVTETLGLDVLPGKKEGEKAPF